MVSKRERYENANMRGGLGVRKRRSEESMRDTYRLNGVSSGMAVARCLDKYGRWEYGYTIGVIVRKTASVVQIRWADDPDETVSYNQGDARYEVDRERWRILGIIQGNPLDPDNPLAVALTSLRQNARIEASADAETPTPPTEEPETEETEETMTNRELSNAAAERQAAKAALKNGDLQERETYTAKQVASRCGTDSKTMRKFFRSNNSTVEPVGQGGRYEFAATDLPKIKREFNTWQSKSKARTPKPVDQVHTKEEIAEAKRQASQLEVEDFTPDQIEAAVEDQMLQENAAAEEPTDEELAELEGFDPDLDDLDMED